MGNSYHIRSIFLWVVAGLLFGAGCSNDEGTPSYDLFDVTPVSDINIEFEELYIDTLQLEPIESSYVGFINISGDSIRFIDERFGWVFVFDEEGNAHTRHLGQGQGPKELPMAGIQFYGLTPEGDRIIIGSSNDYYMFNQNYERAHQEIIRWDQSVSTDELARNPDPGQQRSYNLSYDLGEIMVTSNHIYLPLVSSPPPFSEFNFTTDLFAEKARVLARLDIITGELETIMGRYPPVFSENSNARTFSYFQNKLINENQIAISYMPDSLIYITDLDFNVEYAFGAGGRNMNTNYSSLPPANNSEALLNHIRDEFQEKGYYTALTYIPERNLFFRSYTRGENQETHGLQVYRDDVLIADVDVPKFESESGLINPARNFKVAGYIDPWFYSNARIDEAAEKITVYRFRIDD